MIERAELDSLERPITAEQPCGESLEDSAELAAFDAFRVFGQVSAWEQPPDWRAVRTKSFETLERSKDLRLLAHFGAAVVRTDGLAGLCQVLKLAPDWLDTFWDQVYPGLDEDGIFRRNALSCFADRIAIIDALRRAPLVASRQLGTFSLRDLELAQGVLQPTEADTTVPLPTQISAAFAAMPLAELVELGAVVSVGLLSVKRIETKMREAAGSEGAPDFQALTAQLQRIDKALREHLAAHPDAVNASAVGGGGDPATEGGTASSAGAVGAIRSRQDAIRALDAVAQFFRQTEPSSPVPLFVDRAKRLIAKNFLEVLEDIVPDAVPQARQAGGMRDSA
jgi:type VI secretion system protein ImpA